MSVGWFMRIVNTYSSCGRVDGLLVEVYSRHIGTMCSRLSTITLYGTMTEGCFNI